jgi:enoyl-[acyl-carrier-protein] reductase (NADH)
MLASFDQQPEEHEVSGRMNLLGRLTEPQELADAALWLAQGWLASGETLYVDSGQHLLSQPRDVLYLARQ